MVIIYVTLVLFLVQFFHSFRHRKGGKSLPGPVGLPYLGRIWDLPRRHSYHKFKEWSDYYGCIFEMKIFGVNHVWISSERVAKDLLEGQRSVHNSDRPAIRNVVDSKGSGDYLPLLGHNEKWKRQRQFIHHQMSWSISQKHRSIPFQETIQMLVDIIDTPEKYEKIFDDYTGRVISRICYGSVDMFQGLTASSWALLCAISPSENLTNLVPYLNYLPYSLSPWKQREKQRHDRERDLFLEIQDRVRTKGDQLEDSLMRQYLRSGEKKISEDEAAYAIGMTALAGMLTTASVAINFLVAACQYPRWQKALQDEVDSVVGDRMVEFTDAPKLPLLRAFCKELIRWRPIIPEAIPHETEKDDWYEGQFIPAGSYIHPNGWAISRDPELYPNPETFNPSRFLSPDYPTYKEPLTVYPNIRNMFIFGYGRRACMGQDIVDNELICMIGNLAWACNITKKLDDLGSPIPIASTANDASYTAQLISRPKDFPFDLAPRFEKRATQVREIWRTHNDSMALRRD